MVVKPKELDDLTSNEEKTITFLEERIDKNLLKADPMNNSFTVFVDGAGISPRVKMKIKEMYEEAGWKEVNFHGEQMEGNWIEFIK